MDRIVIVLCLIAAVSALDCNGTTCTADTSCVTWACSNDNSTCVSTIHMGYSCDDEDPETETMCDDQGNCVNCTPGPDCNNNQKADNCDIDYLGVTDCNGDGTPDECQATCENIEYARV